MSAEQHTPTPACDDCGSTSLRHEPELMRPWITERHCEDCGWIGRYES